MHADDEIGGGDALRAYLNLKTNLIESEIETIMEWADDIDAIPHNARVYAQLMGMVYGGPGAALPYSMLILVSLIAAVVVPDRLPMNPITYCHENIWKKAVDE